MYTYCCIKRLKCDNHQHATHNVKMWLESLKLKCDECYLTCMTKAKVLSHLSDSWNTSENFQ